MRTTSLPALAAATVLLLTAAPEALAVTYPAGSPDPRFGDGTPTTFDLARAAPRSTMFDGVFVDGQGRAVAGGRATSSDGQSALAVGRVLPDGSKDQAFGSGGGGHVFEPSLSQSNPSAYLVDAHGTPGGAPFGGVYATGANGRRLIAVARFTPSGQPDLNFGSGGIAVTQPKQAGHDVQTTATAVDPATGAFYVTGFDSPDTTSAPAQFTLTKFTSEGQLQTTGFATNGTYFGGFAGDSPGSYTLVRAVTVLPSGKILVAGLVRTNGVSKVLLARFTTAGAVDSTFGEPEPDGLRLGYTLFQGADPSASVQASSGTAIGVAPDNSIYVAGQASDAVNRSAAFVARFTATGSPDTSFGVRGGKRVQAASTPPEPASFVTAMAIQGDGKPVLVGSSTSDSEHGTLTVIRLLTNGSLDESFGTQGVVQRQLAAGGTATQRTSGQGAAIGGDGNLTVAGSTQTATVFLGYVTRVLLAPYTPPEPPGPPAPPAPPAPPGSPAPPASGGSAVPPPVPLPRPSGGSRLAGVARLAASRLTVARGRVSLPLTCSAAGPCSGVVQLVESSGRVVAAARRPRAAKVYARARFSLPAGARRTITARLSRVASGRLRGRGPLRARLAIGGAAPVRVTLTRTAAARPR